MKVLLRIFLRVLLQVQDLQLLGLVVLSQLDLWHFGIQH